MQPILDHLDNIVRPTLRNYVTADRLFMEARQVGPKKQLTVQFAGSNDGACEFSHT
jgi:hypothetical protein